MSGWVLTIFCSSTGSWASSAPSTRAPWPAPTSAPASPRSPWSWMASKWTSSDLVTFYLILLSLYVMFLPPYCVLFIKVEYKFLSHIVQIFWNFNFLCFEYSADWDSADLFVLFCRYRFMHEQRRMEPETKLWSIFVFSLRSDSDSNQILWKPDQRTEGWQTVCGLQKMCRHWKHSDFKCSHFSSFLLLYRLLTDID